VERFELKTSNSDNLYNEIALALEPYKERDTLSVEFIVEGNASEPIIGIRYPGKKVTKRASGIAPWGNLFDFLVVPYENHRELQTQDFTFEKLLQDFDRNKMKSEEFWKCVEEIYYKNSISREPPELHGINSKLFLLVLKWIWIQEDFNYRLNWQDVGSKVRYVLLSRKGSVINRGVGRAKFFAAMILLKYHFTIDEVKKIVPLFA